MKRFYIGFSQPVKKKVGSELIKWWQSTTYSHTYVRFESETLGLSTVYQAAHGMVHFMEYSRFQSINKIEYEFAIDVSDALYSAILQDCMLLAGADYAFLELIAIFGYDILQYMHINWLPKDSAGFVCSELVGGLMEKRLSIGFNKPTFLLKPVDVFKPLSTRFPCTRT